MEEGGRGAAPGLAVVLEGAAAGMAPGGSAAGLPPPPPPLLSGFGPGSPSAAARGVPWPPPCAPGLTRVALFVEGSAGGTFLQRSSFQRSRRNSGSRRSEGTSIVLPALCVPTPVSCSVGAGEILLSVIHKTLLPSFSCSITKQPLAALG